MLAPLGEQAAYIFVTQQVVAEVQRNKIQVAAGFLGKISETLKLQTSNVPDHLSSTSAGQDKEILGKMHEVSEKIKKINKDVDVFTLTGGQRAHNADRISSTALCPFL